MINRPATLNNNEVIESDLVVTQDDATQLVTTDVIPGINMDYNSVKVDYTEEEVYSGFLSHLVKFVSRTVTSVPSNSILSYDLFKDYYTLAIAGPLVKLKNYRYFTGTMRITLVTQGAASSYGTFVVYAVPRVKGFTDSPGGFPNIGMVRSYIVPHITIDPSKTSTYTLDLPCPTPNGVWDRDFSGSYEVGFKTINPLSTGTSNASDFNYTMYVSMENIVPCALTLTSGVMEKEVKEGAFSGPLKTISKYSSYLAFIPSLSTTMTLTSKTTGALADFVSWFGYAKPNDILANQVITNRVHSNMSHANGKHQAYTYASDETNSISLSDKFYGFGSMEDLSLASLASRFGYIGTTPIPQTAVYGDLLFSYPVRPSLAFAENDSIELTPLGYATALFEEWHGELTFTVEIIASVFHRATILLAYEPHSAFGLVSTADDAIQGLRTKMITVSGNVSVDFTIPWRQARPFVQNDMPNYMAPPSFGDNGIFGAYLINPVTANGSTDPIYVNMFIRGDKMRMMKPDVERYRGFMLAAGLVVPDTADTSNEEDYYLRFGGENMFTTTKALASKSSSFLAPVENSLTFQFSPRIANPNTASTDEHFSFLGFLSAAYTGTRGSMNFTLVKLAGDDVYGFVSPSTTTTYPSTYGTYVPPILNQTGFSWMYSKIHNSLDITVPHYYPAYFRPTRINVGDLDLHESVGVSDVTGGAHTWIPCHSLGDDGTFVNFVGMPAIKPKP